MDDKAWSRQHFSRRGDRGANFAGTVQGEFAACANVLPAVESIYRWKGNIENGTETLVFFKLMGDRGLHSRKNALTPPVRGAGNNFRSAGRRVARVLALGDGELQWIVGGFWGAQAAGL
jgi:hypothetical protein